MIILIWEHKNEDIEKVPQNIKFLDNKKIKFYLINTVYNISL